MTVYPRTGLGLLYLMYTCCIFLIRAEKAGQVWLVPEWDRLLRGWLLSPAQIPNHPPCLSLLSSVSLDEPRLSFLVPLILLLPAASGFSLPSPIHAVSFFPLVFLSRLPHYLWAEWRRAICITLFIRGNFMFCIFTRKGLCHPQTIFTLKEDPTLLDIHLDLIRNSLC